MEALYTESRNDFGESISVPMMTSTLSKSRPSLEYQTSKFETNTQMAHPMICCKEYVSGFFPLIKQHLIICKIFVDSSENQLRGFKPLVQRIQSCHIINGILLLMGVRNQRTVHIPPSHHDRLNILEVIGIRENENILNERGSELRITIAT